MEKTKKIITIAIVLNIAIWSAVAFVAWNMDNRHDAVILSLSSTEKDLKKDEDLRAIKRSLADNVVTLERINDFFITPDGVVYFIELIENLGDGSGISLNISSVTTESDPKNKSDFKEIIRLRLETIGSWQNTYRFLSLLESLPYKGTIEQVNLNINLSGEKLLFDVAPTKEPRTWKGYFEVSFLKIK
ncbi:MAG: hypothetical protein A2653_01840 [Candidatus Zambryskibacteria bacterium RIFCSPHIGHO2_01_FULL_43_25]|uniref:Uncharacterized protein n=1 Tax=Candidatus Zambryskibacteria bacterium RIFCSPLOWO2_01_FULL_45_21 TaxID=1802761 RepID=A0A1G2U3A2_9BACT|nr:MAG: hypothetical protein A2653_01840 [Candidatus Zambryskibacteria bacterium RIFCSPHIGHO2_01_FULL_43_25]OHB01089.1 MAG: hypothetical protein A3E94_00525 [Candidatus Zambryskibacteria bacterium RIFCSPHIGHO2_12_FULL_44_12b]OHB03360.1 MAG: hypothetical protein A3B14_00440 [Candidatus Zambryskibacteria bacterium RIFCSPLOWO2_01_FULL_45_21]